MNCIIILVGTELLNGATVDTNSVYMAEELNRYGIKVKYKLSVGDNIDEILEVFKFAQDRCDLVIVSGGLGPTDDDLTKAALSIFLDKKMIVEKEELDEIKEKFKKRKIIFLDKNIKEIEKPEGSFSIKNDVGMAPAIYTEKFALFPGVPRELKNMFPKFLKLIVDKKVDPIYIKDILVVGIPESIIEEKIKKYFVEKNIEYEFLLKDYGIVVRMQSSERYKKNIEQIKEKIYSEIAENIIGEDDDRIEKKIVELLEKKGYNISVAESCTGGLLSAKLIEVPGISKFLKEGIVSYSNEAKVERLKVPEEKIEKFGAVSKEIAKDMVKGLKTDVAISTTGIAGPDGGTKEKPVGLVYVGIKVRDKIFTYRFNFIGDREQIRNRAVLYSLFELFKVLKIETN